MAQIDHLSVEDREKIYGGQQALITGAGNGIGFAFAQYLRSAKARDVRGIDLNFSDLNITKQHHVSVTDRQGLSALASAFYQADRKLNLLILSAGITQSKTGDKIGPNELQHIVNVNLAGTINTFDIFSPFLSDAGTIIFLSSDTIRLPKPTKPVYTYTKQQIDLFAQHQARQHPEWRVLTLLPGPVETQLFLKGKDHDDILRIEQGDGILKAGEFAEIVFDRIVPYSVQYPSGSRIVIYKNKPLELV